MKPILLHYFVTYRCNARCRFCDIWRREDRNEIGDADGRDVLTNLPAARKLGARFVDFTGGEPLLARDLPVWLRAAKALGYRTSVTTNCILYPARASELKGLVDLLHFSLDSIDAETHDELRGVPCYDRVMESLEIARKLGERPDILFTVTPENFQEVEPAIELAQKLRLMLILNPEYPYFGRIDGSVLDYDRLERWGRRPYVYINFGVLDLMRAGGNDPNDSHCRAVSSTLAVSPDNKLVLPCYHHQNDEVAINGDLAAAVRSDARRKALEMQGRYPACRGCAVSCYFDPSFLYRFDRPFRRSMHAKLHYGYYKYFLPALRGRPAVDVSGGGGGL
jgi:MoaA/NifB/PqqE/SkfB family radical SAM enzyme